MQAQFISSTRSRAERVQAAKETFTYKWWHAVVATVLALITSYFSFVIFVDVHTEPEVTLDIGIIYGRTFKDLEALMLRWVRDNILSFGGNPHNIVLMGVGGGAVAAGYHLISPMTRGFTRRAILHSGSPMMPFPEPGAEDPILEIAVRAQCIDAGAKTITDSTTVVNCIRRTPTSKLRGAVTDGHFPGANDAFLPEKFGILLEQSHDQSAQVLVGNVINEGRVMVGHSFRNMTSEEWRSTDQNMIRTNLVNFLKPYNVDNITRIINCYLSDQESGSQGQQNVTFQHVASAVLGDMLFVCPMKRFAERFSQRRNRVHYFVFNYSPATTLVQSDDATQFDDLLTLFGINLDSTEFDFSAALMEVWGDFVKSGDLPSGQWTPFTKASKNYVFLSNRKDVKGNFEPKKEFREETCDYWTEYLDKQEKKTSTETRHAYDQCGALNPNI